MARVATIQITGIQRVPACDGNDPPIWLQSLGAEGSYLKMGENGKLSLLAGGENPSSADNACKFDVKNHQGRTTFTSLAFPQYKIVAHPNLLTVDGISNEDSEEEWYVDESSTWKRMYIKNKQDERSMFFWISYKGPHEYHFELRAGDDKKVTASDHFQFSYIPRA